MNRIFSKLAFFRNKYFIRCFRKNGTQNSNLPNLTIKRPKIRRFEISLFLCVNAFTVPFSSANSLDERVKFSEEKIDLSDKENCKKLKIENNSNDLISIEADPDVENNLMVFPHTVVIKQHESEHLYISRDLGSNKQKIGNNVKFKITKMRGLIADSSTTTKNIPVYVN